MAETPMYLPGVVGELFFLFWIFSIVFCVVGVWRRERSPEEKKRRELEARYALERIRIQKLRDQEELNASR